MTRIGGSAPGNIQPQSSPRPEKEKELSIYHLPEELPHPSHAKVSSLDLAKLFLPDGVDLEKVPKEHPVRESMNRLWLEVTLRAIVSGGEHSKSSLPISPPMEPLG